MAYSYATYKVKWDPSSLREVLDRSYVSYRQVCDVTGIPIATLTQALNGRMQPNVSLLMTLADYFGISIGCLCGETELPHDFEWRFTCLRRKDYEGTFLHRKDLAPSDKFGEAPFPYNLLDDIVGPSGWDKHKTEDGFWDSIVTPDQEAALQYLLATTFKEREVKAIGLYYEEGYSLQKVGDELGLTRERVRQILARAVRQLRHPSRFKLLAYGLDGYERHTFTGKKQLQLEEEEERLDAMEQELMYRRQYLEAALSDSPSPVKTDVFRPWETSIEEMDLSVRSFNCLTRAGFKTVADVIRQTQEGYSSFFRIRNLGRKSVEEIFGKLKDMTGTDYRDAAIRVDMEREGVQTG